MDYRNLTFCILDNASHLFLFYDRDGWAFHSILLLFDWLPEEGNREGMRLETAACPFCPKNVRGRTSHRGGVHILVGTKLGCVVNLAPPEEEQGVE